MNITIGRSGTIYYGNCASKNYNSVSDYNQRKTNGEDSASSLRELLSEKRRKQKNTSGYEKILQTSSEYGQSIRTDRTNQKKSATRLKKLRYSFKAVSTQIMRSKTSVSAKQVAGKARREVVRLKQKLTSSEYDPEEVRIALTHAQKIERVAKKKVKHLMEEEMVKVTGGPCVGELEEREETKNQIPADKEENVSDDIGEDISGLQEEIAAAMQEQMQSYQEMMQTQMEQMQQMAEAYQEEMTSDMDDMMSELMEEMEESMKELLEESGLSDLMDSMFGGTDMEMDPADYQMMKLKHRAKELKEIAKADAEYLKAVFDRLEKMKDAAMQGMDGTNQNSNAGMMIFSGGMASSAGMESAAEIVRESGRFAESDMTGSGMSSGSMPMTAAGVSFDVSV